MKKFTKTQNKILSEIYRRLNGLSKGNLNEPLLYLAFPSEANVIKEFDLITPYSIEHKRVLNWYRLTEKGKTFFQNYVTKRQLSYNENHRLFTGETIKTFDINLLK